MRSGLGLSIAEEESLTAFRSLTRSAAKPSAGPTPAAAQCLLPAPATTPAEPARSGLLVGDAIIDGLAHLGIEGETQALALGALAVVDEATYTVDSDTAVLRSAVRADRELLLGSLVNRDCAVTLELALDTLPPGHWAIAALLSNAVHLALSRRRVGPALKGLGAHLIDQP